MALEIKKPVEENKKEHEYWEQLREECLKPSSTAFALEEDLKRKFAAGEGIYVRRCLSLNIDPMMGFCTLCSVWVSSVLRELFPFDCIYFKFFSIFSHN